MAKRSSLVVLSSDDDEDIDKYRSSISNKPSISSICKRSSKPKLSGRRRSSGAKSAKKARFSDLKNYSHFDEFKWSCEEMDEDFAGFKVSAGSRRPDGMESWVDKYRPSTLEELAVHKKKVEEVRVWFEERLKTSKVFQNYVLLITGQAGVGKTATVQVIASHFGAQVCEWNTPTPTIWHEHVHNLNSGLRYMSKLDEFENFVDRVRKYGLLSSSLTGTATSMILLIDDLPLANGKIGHRRLLNCLQVLVKSVRVPTAILITDYGGADFADVNVRLWEELPSSLESTGACKVAFNPITINSIKKVLSGICRQEQFTVTSEHLDLIAKSSGGDIRHAITSLQYFCLKQDSMLSISSECIPFDTDSRGHDVSPMDDTFSLPFGRDQTLSLFHALGKFLHNKRETEHSAALDTYPLKEEFVRSPLKMDAPEKVLCQAYGQARPVAEFLHENVLDFLSEEAIEDAWAVASYLSGSDYLLASLHKTFARDYEAENIVQSAAASVAVRGVLFGNAHPSPSRWHTMRRPKLWQVEQSARRNLNELTRQRLVSYNGLSFTSVTAISIEYRPVLKWLGVRASVFRGSYLEDDEFDPMSSVDQENETSEDEIEDW